MPDKKKTKKALKTPKEQKLYMEKVPKKPVYIGLGILLVVAVGLFLCVPHYKPVHLASDQQIQDAHHDIIQAYFLHSTVCPHDNLSKSDRVKAFNKYFKVNEYGNRAVIRGCNDNDSLLARSDAGKWQKTEVNIVLSSRQNPAWQKACYIYDITVSDTKIRPENSSIDSNNLRVCDSLAKQSYVEVNLKLGIHFHF